MACGAGKAPRAIDCLRHDQVVLRRNRGLRHDHQRPRPFCQSRVSGEELLDLARAACAEAGHGGPPAAPARHPHRMIGQRLDAGALQGPRGTRRQPAIDGGRHHRRRQGLLRQLLDGIPGRAGALLALGRRVRDQRGQVVAVPKPCVARQLAPDLAQQGAGGLSRDPALAEILHHLGARRQARVPGAQRRQLRSAGEIAASGPHHADGAYLPV